MQNNKSKIFVLHLRELIYTIIFLFLFIVLIVLIISMFSSKNDSKVTSASETSGETTTYTGGIYHSCITLANSPIELEVIVDTTHIKSINLVSADTAIPTMYPLLESSVDSLEDQICLTSSTEQLTYSSDSKYTSLVLLEGIQNALDKAVAN